MFCNHADGFTLVELMIAMAMSGLLISAVYAAYILQQRSATNQSQVVEMQQNIRASMEMLGGDIRMALYDPSGSAGADIPTANKGQLRIRMDLNKDGDLNDSGEDITYRLSDDSDSDGISDSGSADLLRIDPTITGTAIIANNIQALEFNYFYQQTSGDFAETTTPTADQLKDLYWVEVSILAIARQRDSQLTQSFTYTSGSGQTWGPFTDNMRRRLLVSTFSIRNQGIKE